MCAIKAHRCQHTRQPPTSNGEGRPHDRATHPPHNPDDERRLRDAVSAVTGAVRGVRGQDYAGLQSFDLRPPGSANLHYPTSGTVDDYAYSRHIVDPTVTKVYGITLEFGLKAQFQPPWEEMQRIVADVSAGMVELCAQAREHVVYIGFD